MSDVKSLRVEHAKATREAIISAGLRGFASDGFRATSIDRIAAEARVTKGAVYHHFKDKRALFREVYARLAVRVHDRVAARLADVDGPLDRIRAGVEAFLDSSGDREVRRVMFSEGPAVLAGECRKIDDAYFLGMLHDELASLEAAGLLSDVDIRILAELLLGLLIEASQLLGRSDDLASTRAELEKLLPRLLMGVLAT